MMMKKIVAEGLFSQKDSSKDEASKIETAKGSTSTRAKAFVSEAKESEEKNKVALHTKLEIHLQKDLDAPVILDRSHLIDQPFSFVPSEWSGFISRLQNGEKSFVQKKALKQNISSRQSELFDFSFETSEGGVIISALYDFETQAKEINEIMEEKIKESKKASSLTEEEEAGVRDSLSQMLDQMKMIDMRRFSFKLTHAQWQEVIDFFMIDLDPCTQSLSDLLDDF